MYEPASTLECEAPPRLGDVRECHRRPVGPQAGPSGLKGVFCLYPTLPGGATIRRPFGPQNKPLNHRRPILKPERYQDLGCLGDARECHRRPVGPQTGPSGLKGVFCLYPTLPGGATKRRPFGPQVKSIPAQEPVLRSNGPHHYSPTREGEGRKKKTLSPTGAVCGPTG